ncbi:MAG: hypothetical protein BWY03_00412 [Parcubacteria group bacterium ADurb.Bin159]|nr:MAG: hypothetical protein BWY03_00412 [Parcubacteria group bacterium ADurb.Bin159]
MKTKKYLLVSLFLVLLFGSLALPQRIEAVEMTKGMDVFMSETELSDIELPVVIGKVISWILGFLGLIATIIIIIGGFMWMTSGGDEEKINKAKKLMINGLIGLAIVLVAYIISNFVIDALTTEILVE